MSDAYTTIDAPPFVQISACADQGQTVCYALDGDGRVWVTGAETKHHWMQVSNMAFVKGVDG